MLSIDQHVAAGKAEPLGTVAVGKAESLVIVIFYQHVAAGKAEPLGTVVCCTGT